MHHLPRRYARILLLLLSLPIARADGIWSGGPCLSACQLWLSLVSFTDMPDGLPFLEKRCAGGMAAESLYLCAEMYCPEENLVEELRSLNESCRTVNSTLPPVHVIAEYTEEDWARVRRVDAVSEDGSDVHNEVVLPSESLHTLARNTLTALDYVQRHHNGYGRLMFWFWALVVLIGMLRHALHVLIPPRTRPDPDQYLDRETLILKEKPQGVEYPWLQIKRFITLPATFGYRCLQNVGWCTIPPRAESLAILAFFLLNVACTAQGYIVFTGNLYFPPTSKQIWRYVSDRAGIISWASFPVIWLFGMRNNLLMGLTGWDFGTFNNFHRWIARIATLQAVVHSVGYTVIVWRVGGWPYFAAYFDQLFWWTGEVATVAMCALVGASVFWLRRNRYEAFLVIHIVLSVIILITMLLHVSIFLGEYDSPFWICTFIWLADRLLRTLRVLAYNPWFWNTRANLTYSKKSNTVRLVVPCTNSAYKPKPGTYYYVYVLNDSRPWESHPFTMAYATTGHNPAATETVSLLHGNASALPTESSAPSMTFLVRPYDGFTSRLKNLAKTNDSPRVLIEGPYGMTQPLDTFDDVLFIVGGSGIAAPLAYLSQLNASPRVRSVRIVWSLREASFADEVLRYDMAGTFRKGKVAVDMFLTGLGRREDGEVMEWPNEVRIVAGRPDVTAEIQSSAQEAVGGRLAVVACGPARMADDSRAAVVGVLGEGFHRVEYFQEAFNW